MGLSDLYHAQIEQNGYTLDEGQSLIVAALERLSEKLGADPGYTGSIWGGVLSQFLSSPKQPLRGCYIWGGTGRGKTWLMDLFYHSLGISEKRRKHFSVFMQEVHQSLAQLGRGREPLTTIAADIAHRCRVLCLDEFHVTDITDAMLMRGLLRELFRRNVVLVVTSNLAPDELYKNGLQREQFVPAIELIKQHTHVINLQGDRDHRCSSLLNRPSYFITGEVSYHDLREYLYRRYPEQTLEDTVHLNGRNIATLYLSRRCVWFDFHSICGDGRATSDYLQLANQFDCIAVTHIPTLTQSMEDLARRFVHLIDVLYDAQCHVIIGAQVMPTHLYQGRLLQHEFQRTASRLQEIAVQERL
ncbi:MAG: cell division protein ZapE [Gammaproteobacteria bacterium]|nr:cell division protein ZapE [Gammaproteobacteria bacterium]MDH5802042.1 cell division protein ZapE [Gammaproteobacteria bacterium]